MKSTDKDYANALQGFLKEKEIFEGLLNKNPEDPEAKKEYANGGLSNYIYNQICVDMKFEDFYELYVSIPQKHKLIIDLIDTSIRID